MNRKNQEENAGKEMTNAKAQSSNKCQMSKPNLKKIICHLKVDI
jgi:hypothetical protein